MENKPQNKRSIIALVRKHKFHFFLDVFIVFLITFSVLYLFGLVPPEFQTIIGRYPDSESTDGAVGELPLQLEAPEVGIDTQVYNPATTSNDVLNDYLLKGAVRYPGSGLPGGVGNIFIFGHSTGFKVVHNQAFKTFVGLDNLKPGDPIYLYSSDNEYIYKVLDVKMETADQALVVFNTKSNMLTISTCDVFGEKSDRYVAEAEFVKKMPIQTSTTQ